LTLRRLRSLVLLEDRDDGKRHSITLDIGYMDSNGVGIYIMFIINLPTCLCNLDRTLFPLD
jgi:hypothetical protein